MNAAAFPLPVRERLAATIRKEDAPGPARVARIRSLGLLPLEADADATKSATSAKSEQRMSSHPVWDSFAASVRATLAPCNDPLSLFLPGLRLFTENTVQRGGKIGGKKLHPIQVRTAAKCHAIAVLVASPLRLWRFTEQVRIEVWQVRDDCTVDPGNLYAKALIDLLLERGDGLGILADDSRRFVSFVGTGYRASRAGEVGVWIDIRCERKAVSA